LEINHFFECIKEKKKPQLGSSKDAVELMEVIEKIYKN
jgi:predicted dehydrogenase